MTVPERCRLPNRRANATIPIEAGGIAAYCTIGYAADGTPAEIFLRPRSGAQVGSGVDHLVDDVAVIISLALQYGVPPGALARSMARLPTGEEDGVPTRPATVIGEAVDCLVREAAMASEQASNDKPWERVPI